MGKQTRSDQVKIDGKYYYKFCSCGNEKFSLKTAYCPDCYRKKYFNGVHRSRQLADSLLKLDSTLDKNEPTKDLKKNKKHLIEFVERIESKGGWADMRETFVELITLFNFFGRNASIDTYPPNSQLEFMWNSLKMKYHTIKNHGNKKLVLKKDI